MDAIVLLKRDHKAVDQLFRQFEKSKDSASSAAKRELVEQMIEQLSTHAYIEERIFYPAARAAMPDTTEHVLESVEEHHVVAWLLSELNGLDPADETFDAKVMVLIENVRHHVEEEEQEWFPEVRRTMGRKRLAELADQLEVARSQAPSDPLKLASARA